MVLGPDGPLGQATRVTIDETDDPEQDRPARVVVRGTSPSLDLTLDFAVESGVRTSMTAGPRANGLDFFQLRGRYSISGTAGDQPLSFTAPGAAETFRGRTLPVIR
jgi:hypothetical protein